MTVLLSRALGVPWLQATTPRGHNALGGCPVLVAAPWLCPGCPGQHSEAEVPQPPQPGQGWDCRAMSSVHYKFSSKLSYDVVTFRGPSISVGDLKRQIMARERLKVANCDLQILKAETSEEYSDDAQIPKNVSVIVKRVPARAM
ncbi:E3 ubiquitin-protein ligase RBBP6 [Lonchura striata]